MPINRKWLDHRACDKTSEHANLSMPIVDYDALCRHVARLEEQTEKIRKIVAKMKSKAQIAIEADTTSSTIAVGDMLDSLAEDLERVISDNDTT